MPQHKSAKKRMRQDKKRGLRNKALKSQIRSSSKRVRQSATAEEAAEALSKCTSLLDKAVKRSVLHKSTAGRTKSRLAKAAKKTAQ
jgi:small subunit ribosomal protein S20